MAVTVTVPNEYGYVILTTVSSLFLNVWHSAYVGSYRKAAKIPYPNAYASAEQAKASPAAHAFNCAQRAHANFLEHYPSTLVATLIGGLRYPLLASFMGVGWIVGRTVFAMGYARSEPKDNGKGRYKGIWYLVFQLGLFGLAAKTGVDFLFP